MSGDSAPPAVDKLTGSMTRSPWTPDREHWREFLAGQPGYRLDQLWQGLYQRLQEPDQISNLPKSLRQSIAAEFTPALRPVEIQRSSDDATIKWLLETDDGSQVETVLMHYHRRSTVCISSQAGCAMGCGFCATGQAGFDRNLSVGEILEQVVVARRQSEAEPSPDKQADKHRDDDGDQGVVGPRRLSNVVFMGMGEPMANYDRVLEATRRLIVDFGIGARHITISTVGLVPQMLRLAEEGLQVGLALSLHAANDTLRNELVPVNRRHPISELVAACQLFRQHTGRRVSIEWAMIDGVNDRPQDADELAAVAVAARAHVNLIPLNPTPGWPTVGSPRNRIVEFADRLRQAGIAATIRQNRGTDIDAACGQLAGSRPRANSGSEPGAAADGPTSVQLRQRR